jgi:hypothetical protein
MTPLTGKKLGLLLSTAPGQPGFEHGLALARTALDRGLRVYVYCLDEAVHGLNDARLHSLQQQGLILYACAYGARKRQIAPSPVAVFAGLGVLTDLMAATDRFVSLN